MSESSRRVRRAVLFGAALLAVAPWTSADATPDQWSGSHFNSPFNESSPTIRRDGVSASGTFEYQKAAASDEVTGAVITVADDPGDSFTPRSGCTSPPPIAFGTDGNDPAQPVDTLAFTYSGMQFNCNGRYVVEALGSSNGGGGDSYAMSRSVLVEIPPSSVEAIRVTTSESTGAVTVEWDPIPDPAIDALGYAVERAGPADESGDVGAFGDIATTGVSSRRRVTDQLETPGTYQYRVRAIRDGASGQVRSSVLTTGTANASFSPPTTTTTSTVPATTRPLPQIGTGGAGPTDQAPGVSTPPTTIDTGFEELLDYGSRLVTEAVPDELASEDPLGGQSIVRNEGGGTGYLIPVAGALVLVIWAGHLVYLNRLAREL